MSLPLRSAISRAAPASSTTPSAQVAADVGTTTKAGSELAVVGGGRHVFGSVSGKQTRCAHRNCGQSLVRRPGPGRPPRFCSDQCRHAARRDLAKVARTVRAPQAAVPFNAALREAVMDSRLSLQEISDLLRQQDRVQVARSTLSSWQCSTTPQRGPIEDARIYALERVLQLRRGKLLLLLDADAANADGGPPAQTGGDAEVRSLRARAGQLGGVRNCITIAVEDNLLVAGRKPQHRTIQQKVRAIGSNVDCYWTIYAPDVAGPEVRFDALQGCRIGRKVAQGDLVAVELLFDRILEPGEAHAFTFRVGEQQLTQPVRDFRRWAGPPALESLRMSVIFDGPVPPKRVLACQWTTREQLAGPSRQVQVLDGAARLWMSHPPAGMYGLSWKW